MVNRFARAAARMEARLSDWASVPINYQRAGLSIGIDAAIGRTTFQIDNGAGLIETFESRDFLIPVADLVLADEVILPRAGDRIREPHGGQVFIYEVMAPGNEPCWRYSDSCRRMLRVHTKQVSVEQV